MNQLCLTLILTFLCLITIRTIHCDEVTTNGTGNLTDLYFLGLWPMDGPWAGGLGLLPAAFLALQHVNADPSVLPGYRLNMIWNDTQVSFIKT